jgi:hypothetical protein
MSQTLVYCGPDGAEHPELGTLRTGEAYVVENDALAAYWCSHDPEQWQPVKPAVVKEADHVGARARK